MNRPGNRRVPMVAGSIALALSLSSAQSGAQSEMAADTTPAAVSESTPVPVTKLLGQLPAGEQQNIERLCLPVQFKQGATAYRDCILNQLDTRSEKRQAGGSLPAISSLSFDEQVAIQRFCQSSGPIGSDAYRRCSDEQAGSLAGSAEPALDRLSNDESYVVQQACFDSQTGSGVRNFRDCINTAISRLLSVPRPDLSALALLDRNALQLRCSAQHTDVADYRSCLLDAVSGRTTTDEAASPRVTEDAGTTAPEPEPDTTIENPALVLGTDSPQQSDAQTVAVESPVAVTDSNTVQVPDSPSGNGAGPASAETGLTQLPDTAGATALDQPDAMDPSGAIPAAEPVAQQVPEVSVSAAGAGNLVTPDSGADAENPPGADDPALRDDTVVDDGIDGSVAGLLMRTKSSIAGLTGINRIILFAALGLPVFLVGYWLFMRGRSSSEREYIPPAHPYPLRERVGVIPPGTSGDSKTALDEAEDGDLATHTAASDRSARTSQTRDTSPPQYPDFAAQADELFGDTAVQDSAQTVLKPAHDTARRSAQRPSQRPAHQAVGQAAHPAAPSPERAAYFTWLSGLDESRQTTMAIEFLIYWMAYADERYEPELKKKIFQLREPDEHELIKRWVLKQDVHAFADNLLWVQRNLSAEQCEQIINLLMALLVNENALTPAQNTLLRFLADAFGLGHARLETLFRSAFGQDMPALPRPDRPQWWEQQSADSLKRWDARSVSRQHRDIQYRVKLGLPLSGDLEERDIMASFRRAQNRCRPELFNLLSSREHTLVERQLGKVEMARQSLLEVSA